MRVTSFGMVGNYLANLDSVMSQYQKDELQLSTGRRINQPSDDPVGFSSDMMTKNLLNNVQMWTSNAKSAQSRMQIADNALTTLQGILTKIRTQVVEAANGVNTPDNLHQIGSVVKNYIQSVQQVANTSDGNSYIFAGNAGTTPPWATDVTTLAAPPTSSNWTGDTAKQYTYIGHNAKLQTNVSGQAIFATAPTGGTSMMTTLYNIYQHLSGATASNIGSEQTALQADLSNLDSNISQVSSAQADLGGRMDQAQSVTTQLSQMTNTLKAQQSQVQDADVAKLTTSLMTDQTVYQAALQIGTKMILPTLASVL